jgi:hypothetical protein
MSIPAATWRRLAMFWALLALPHLRAFGGDFDIVNRIDSDPLVESVGNTRHVTSAEISTSEWYQAAPLVRNLPIGGTLKEARFLVAAVGGVDLPDPTMPFLQVEDFERFDFSFHVWTEGEKGNSFFANPREGETVLDLPSPGAAGFSFVRLPDTIQGLPLWEVTIDLTPLNLEVEVGQEFAYSLFGARNQNDGYFAIRRLNYSGPGDLNGSWGGTAVHMRGLESGKPFNQLATALTLEIAGPDVIPTATTRATYTGASGGQFSLASNWDQGVAPLDNGTKYNAVIPDDKGVVNFTVNSDVEITHLSTGFGNTLNISGGNMLTVTGQAVIPSTLNVDGVGTIVNLTGPATQIEQLGRINVTGGARVAVAMPDYRMPDSAIGTHLTSFTADGMGSYLDLSTLTEITGVIALGGSSFGQLAHAMEARNGGVLDLSGVRKIKIFDAASFTDVSTFHFRETNGGEIRLDDLESVSAVDCLGYGIVIIPSRTGFSLERLTEANYVALRPQSSSTVALGPPATEPTKQLAFVQGIVEIPNGAAVHAPRLTDFSFSTLKLVGAEAVFEGPNIQDIDGSRFIARDGASFLLGPNPATMDGKFTYSAHFEATFNGLREEVPTLISAGASSQLDMRNLKTMSVQLGTPGLLGIAFSGEISAINGGGLDLSGLELLEVNPIGGLNDPAAMFVNVDSGGMLQLGAPTLVHGVKISVTGATSKLQATSLDLRAGNFPITTAPSLDGCSLLLSDRGKLLLTDSLSFDHELSDVLNASLRVVRDEANVTSGPINVHGGGIDLNRGVVQFIGTEIGTLEVAGPSFTGFGQDGRPITPAGRSEFGIAQLVIGAPGEAKIVELADEVSNANRIGMQNESLYLWGFDEGLPAFVGGPLGDGLGDALVLHSGSTLRIPEEIDVIVYADGAPGGFVHLNQLFGPGVNRLPYSDGFIELVAEGAGDGDFDGDGDTDGRDFLRWQRGESPDPLSPTDFAAWKAGFGDPAATGADAAVPEPSGAVMAALVLLVISRRGR